MHEDGNTPAVNPENAETVHKAPELWTQEKILALGEEAARRISGFSDEVLDRMSRSFDMDSAGLLSRLDYLMSRFDKGDFRARLYGGLLSKLFKTDRKAAERLYEKYIAFSKEVDRIFIEIKKYEYEIKDTNEILLGMYDEIIKYHTELEKEIQCGKTYLSRELEPYIRLLGQRYAVEGTAAARMESVKFAEAREMLEQRIYDLELARALSLQTAPIIKLIQKGNSNLVRKINSAFVVTLPLFKQTVIQAITRKRQKIYMDSMAAIDASSNRLLRQNAKSIAGRMKMSRQADAVNPERNAIEESYNAIINGIREIGQLQKENLKQRESGIHQLEDIKAAITVGAAIGRPESTNVSGVKTQGKPKQIPGEGYYEMEGHGLEEKK